eukprot:228771-Rhodomonas_salina.2
MFLRFVHVPRCSYARATRSPVLTQPLPLPGPCQLAAEDYKPPANVLHEPRRSVHYHDAARCGVAVRVTSLLVSYAPARRSPVLTRVCCYQAHLPQYGPEPTQQGYCPPISYAVSGTHVE